MLLLVYTKTDIIDLLVAGRLAFSYSSL